MGTLGLSRCPIKAAKLRQTAHTARSSRLQEHLQGLLLAESAISVKPPKAVAGWFAAASDEP